MLPINKFEPEPMNRGSMIWGYMGVSLNGGTPIAGWCRIENSIQMDDLGVPLFLETAILGYYLNPHNMCYFSIIQRSIFDGWYFSKHSLELDLEMLRLSWKRSTTYVWRFDCSPHPTTKYVVFSSCSIPISDFIVHHYLLGWWQSTAEPEATFL